jgi:molybdopterin/thiamine biosynthesis adenylyltransferase
VDVTPGSSAQPSLHGARTIVIGAGATGTAAAAQLVSCGVGYVAVVDGGSVAGEDLVGQALYYAPDVGMGKADTAAAKLSLLNPEAHVEAYPVDLDQTNAAAIVTGHDLVLDCTHSPAAGEALDATGGEIRRPSREAGTAAEAGAALGAEAIRLLAQPPVEAGS